MRVLFVTTAYKRYPDDVITPWMVEFIQRLRSQDVNVSVFTSSYKGLKDQVIDGVPVYRFRYFFKKYERLTHEENAVDRLGRGPLNLVLSFFYIIFGSLAILKLTRARRFDIAHVHWPFPHILFGLIARYFGRVKLFATFYGLEIRWLKKKFAPLVPFFSALINRCHVVTAISNHTAAELKNIVRYNIPVIPFSVSTRSKTGAITDDKAIMFAGRSVERKGADYLIKAFASIKNEIPHKLLIVGDGPERSSWEKLARGLDPSHRIQFTGWISDREIGDCYRTCSFFVLPAVYDKHGDTEGLGVVMIEAMSYAKPVIASNVGGITDVVEDGVNGFLVPPAEVTALAQAIKKLALNPSLCQQMGRAAKKIIDDKFNWDRITGRMKSLYEEYN
ncbi:MAG TPA: glycosyltransferase family 4 protein [bacterium]